jgi:hypothetical protein
MPCDVQRPSVIGRSAAVRRGMATQPMPPRYRLRPSRSIQLNLHPDKTQLIELGRYAIANRRALSLGKLRGPIIRFASPKVG